ncbi:hypothetical protein CBER1_05719 [Cercospora berteroae]|uniref:Uncharacterized protein n=1 Tax=Cercospora berteroae TaxID=357750 RepID=A0A2S6C658_9PEZI|nr:hypothetical protein CBER1_05719 [Cercospora berteroae]
MAPTYPSFFTPTYHHDQYPAIDPTQPALDCSNKIVIITGGGRGIGQAIAIGFARAHAKGIILLGRTQTSLEASFNKIEAISPSTDVLITVADIQQPEQVLSAFSTAISHFNTVPDILINNAGALLGVGNIIDVEIEDFWSSFEINTRGPLIVSQAFLRANRSHTPEVNRTIINVSSGAAHVPYAPGTAAYSCAKGAAARRMEFLHHENPGWKIFNIQPGVVATDMTKQAARKALDSPEVSAGLAVWLATSSDARWFKGKFVWANWDVGELLERKEEIVEKNLLSCTLKGWASDVSTDSLIDIARGVTRNAERG